MLDQTWKLGLITLVACGGGGDSASMGPDAGGAGADAASTALTVDVSPSEGQKGVLVDQPLILTFSKPMNTASVEAAWSSASLPAAEMQFSWNTAKTVLSINAAAVLEYPAGGLNVDTYGYEIKLDASAQAVDGEALAAPLTSTFDTARDITVSIPATLTVNDGTGSFNGTVSTTVLRVGDTTTNAAWRTFVTFPLTSLPQGADIVKWTTASLYGRQASIEGTPYADLGSITAGSLAMTSIDVIAHTSVVTNVVGFSLSATVGNPAGDRTANVMTAVKADHDAARTRSSFRLEFTTAQDTESDDDVAILENPRLDLRFLAK
jgi:hypothetical protein